MREFLGIHNGKRSDTAVEWSLEGRGGNTPPKRFDREKVKCLGDATTMITDDMIQVMITELLVMGSNGALAQFLLRDEDADSDEARVLQQGVSERKSFGEKRVADLQGAADKETAKQRAQAERASAALVKPAPKSPAKPRAKTPVIGGVVRDIGTNSGIIEIDANAPGVPSEEDMQEARLALQVVWEGREDDLRFKAALAHLDSLQMAG
jgi:hypothetical protein